MPSIRISQETFDRAKSIMTGQTWDNFLNGVMDKAYGRTTTGSAGITLPPPRPPRPCTMSGDLVYLNAPGKVKYGTHMRYIMDDNNKVITFTSIKEAHKVADQLNLEAGRRAYMVIAEPEDGIVTLQYGESAEEIAQETKRIEEATMQAWEKFQRRSLTRAST